MPGVQFGVSSSNRKSRRHSDCCQKRKQMLRRVLYFRRWRSVARGSSLNVIYSCNLRNGGCAHLVQLTSLRCGDGIKGWARQQTAKHTSLRMSLDVKF